MSEIMVGVTIAAAIGSGVVGGVFFAFSAFVMPALARLPAARGIAAMQSVNIVAVTPPLMMLLFGTALGTLIVGARAVVRWGAAGANLALLAAILYLVGVIGVTIGGNVPRNNALAGVDPVTGTGAALWAAYIPGWTAWNTVRAVAAIAAAAVMTLALLAERTR